MIAGDTDSFSEDTASVTEDAESVSEDADSVSGNEKSEVNESVEAEDSSMDLR